MIAPLAWRLQALMESRQIHGPRDLQIRLRNAGYALSAPQAGRLVKSPPRRIQLELLAALLQVLDCTAHELLWRTPTREGEGEKAGPRPPRSRVARVSPRALFVRHPAGGQP